jgi:hypothetical protein
MTMGESDGDSADLEIRPNPVTKLMPLVVFAMAMIWGTMLSLIPGIPLLIRIATAAVIIWILSELYLTATRRLVVGDDAVDIELTRKKTRIPYADLDYVVVRAMHLGGTLSVTFVTRNPRLEIRTRTGLMSNEVLKTAPRLIRALIIRGVNVKVPGRPDLGTG